MHHLSTPSNRPGRRRGPSVVLGGALAAAVLAALTVSAPGPASAADATGATPAGTRVDLTLVLTPDDRATLRDLPADVAGDPVADRTDAIADAAPDVDVHPDVAAVLAGAGLTVEHADTWEVDAHGTAAQVQALLGVQLVGTGDDMHPVAQPVLGPVFGDAVSAVLGLDLRPVATSSALPGGLAPTQLSSAYAASASATAGSGATVATVQFSGWNRDDLSTYAAAVGRRVPSVTQIAVDGASATTPDGQGGEVEVALDQELLLATAPAASQRIYFAKNDAQGMYSAFARIASEVVAKRITAVSMSWGSCDVLLPSAYRTVLEDAVDRIVAAGATVFAASGDDGTQCPTGKNSSVTSALYPASSPAVVAVGGTTLTTTSGRWVESAWSSGGAGAGTQARPSYQSGIAAAGTRRMVPDIAAMADPAHGAGIYVSGANGTGYMLGGGTSAAAPIMAGQLSSTLASRGCIVGVGDVHRALYANPRSFRDVTTGRIGSYAAGVGYDVATGLGSPNWSALAKALPTASSCAGQASTTRAVSGTTIAASNAVLPGGISLHSPTAQYWLDFQTDGNLVVRGGNRVVWQTGTGGNAGATLRVQTDGNTRIVSSSGRTLWQTGTSRYGAGTALTVSDRGEAQVVQGTTVRWRSSRAGADWMVPGARLAPGWSVWDSGQRRQLVMQSDGNLVLFVDRRARWATNTSKYPGAVLKVQADGNVVLYDAYGRARWSTKTSRYGGKGMLLGLRNDGDVRLTQGSSLRWHTGSKG